MAVKYIPVGKGWVQVGSRNLEEWDDLIRSMGAVTSATQPSPRPSRPVESDDQSQEPSEQ